MKSIIRWIPVIIWSSVIFYLSSLAIIQDEAFSLLDFVFKKTAHVTEYAILFFLVQRALPNSVNKLNFAFLICLAYAFSDEIHQLFTPGRGGSLRDVLVFDTLGITISYLITKKIWKK